MGYFQKSNAEKDDFLGRLMLVFVATGFPLFFITMAMEGRFAPSTDFHFIAAGVGACVAEWLLAQALALAVFKSDNKRLFSLTPLTPSLYYSSNTRRVLPLAIALLVLVPLGLVAIPLLYLRYNPKWPLSAVQTLSLSGSLVLTHFLILLLPFHEYASRQRWTYFVFFPRVLFLLVRKYPRPSILAGFAGVVGMVVFSGLTVSGLVSVPSPVPFIAKKWSELPAQAEIVHYLAIPFSGLMVLHDPSFLHFNAAPLMAILGFFIVVILFRVWRQWYLPMEAWEKKHFTEWVDVRERVEQRNDVFAFYLQMQAQAELPLNILKDKTDADPEVAASWRQTILDRIEKKSLPYLPALSPEEQTLRHIRFWKPSAHLNRYYRHLLLLIPFWSLALIAWTTDWSPLLVKSNLDLGIRALLFVVGFPLMLCPFYASPEMLSPNLTLTCSTLPCRWPQMLKLFWPVKFAVFVAATQFANCLAFLVAMDTDPRLVLWLWPAVLVVSLAMACVPAYAFCLRGDQQQNLGFLLWFFGVSPPAAWVLALSTWFCSGGRLLRLKDTMKITSDAIDCLARPRSMQALAWLVFFYALVVLAIIAGHYFRWGRQAVSQPNLQADQQPDRR